MKRFWIALLLSAFLVPQALGEAAYVSMAQLHKEASAGWHETYQAHGRTIQVDVTVDLPDVQAVPLIQATQYAVTFPKEVTDAYTKVSHNQPGLFDGYVGKLLQKPASGKTKQRDIYEDGAWPATQAEDNPNHFDHALAVVTEHLSALTGYQYPTEYELTLAHVTGRRYVNGKPVSAMGEYAMTFRQLFAGVPLSSLSGTPHAMAASYYNDENFHILANYYYDSYEVLTPDVPLLSFEALREIVEAEILAGRQRSVEGIALRYGVFAKKDQPNVVTLLPVWEVRGNRAANAKEEAKKVRSGGETALLWRSAAMDVLMQNGRCYEIQDKENGCYPMPPEPMTWEDVK